MPVLDGTAALVRRLLSGRRVQWDSTALAALWAVVAHVLLGRSAIRRDCLTQRAAGRALQATAVRPAHRQRHKCSVQLGSTATLQELAHAPPARRVRSQRLLVRRVAVTAAQVSSQYGSKG